MVLTTSNSNPYANAIASVLYGISLGLVKLYKEVKDVSATISTLRKKLTKGEMLYLFEVAI
jgi:hypothetical protein